jgi:hypothetical protein
VHARSRRRVYRNDPDETVIGTISGWNVDNGCDVATILIEEPEPDPKPCTCMCGSAGGGSTGCGSVSTGVSDASGGVGVENSGTPLTYYSHFASGLETIVAYQPLELTNGEATLETVEAKLTEFGQASPNTAIWFDAEDAVANETYAFAIAVDVSGLSTGSYDWTVQLTQHYSDIRYTGDGRIPIDNNLIERLLRPVAIGRKNYLFFGSEKGGQTAATLYTLVQSARRNCVDVWAVLDRRAASHCGPCPRRYGCAGSPVAGSLDRRPSRASAGAAGRRIPRSPGPTPPEAGRTSACRRPIGDSGPESAPVGLLGGSCLATPRMRLDGVENLISHGFPAL